MAARFFMYSFVEHILFKIVKWSIRSHRNEAINTRKVLWQSEKIAIFTGRFFPFYRITWITLENIYIIYFQLRFLILWNLLTKFILFVARKKRKSNIRIIFIRKKLQFLVFQNKKFGKIFKYSKIKNHIFWKPTLNHMHSKCMRFF